MGSPWVKDGSLHKPWSADVDGILGTYRFNRRGLSAVDCEWKLLAATHNILKMWRMAGAIG
jgi:hypothetical protein